MAEEDGPVYQLRTENDEVKTSSRGYTGAGTAFYENGDIYEGDFIDGIRSGTGIYRYKKSGHKYDGGWEENQKSGIGKMAYNGVGEYHGYWENGRRHGEGMFTYKNGDVYSGWWKYGEKEGYGSYIFKETGMKMTGEWNAGQITQGQWIYPNGVYFQGSFKNNKPQGEGTWFFRNGNTLNGTFEQKEKIKGDDDPESEAELDENGDPKPKKPKFDLLWNTSTRIAASAHQVNSVEQ